MRASRASLVRGPPRHSPGARQVTAHIRQRIPAHRGAVPGFSKYGTTHPIRAMGSSPRRLRRNLAPDRVSLHVVSAAPARAAKKGDRSC